MLFVTKLEKSRKVILEMLDDRGYDVSNYNQITQAEIDIMYKNTPTKIQSQLLPLDLKVTNKNDKSKNIIVKYVFNSKIKPSNIESILEEMLENEIIKPNDSLVLISKDKISNEQIFDTHLDVIYKNLNVFVQSFWLDSLVINITHHELVPKHRIISDEDKQGLLQKYDINSLLQLPLILKTDPIAKYLGMKRGDVCEIKRPSETSGIYISYRYCQ